MLTADGSKWHSRRKLLTPTFHFSILEEYIPVFCDRTRSLIEKLRVAANNNPDGFNIGPFITDCAMDHFVSHRIKRPWLLPDWIFRLTPMGREFYKSIKILQDFTVKVIRKRRAEMEQAKSSKLNDVTSEEYDEIGRKRRISFLDLLLKVHENDSNFTELDIRSEVDTFMAAGHHTTAHAISWVFHYLSIYPEIQERCYEELEEIFCGSDRDPILSDLSKMKFLERVIKESMRVKPPVWFVGRKLEKNGYDEFPANTVIHVNIYGIHHNPDVYPDPEKFDPDRFLPENCVGRHPYAYIPFSAGPRNCIGQRFAMLEMKEVISAVLRHFRIESCDPDLNDVGFPAVVLRPAYGIKVRQRFAMLEMKEVISTLLRHFTLESCDPEFNSVEEPGLVLQPKNGVK
ncbi:hypothetical protein B566_EDAN015310, partial [Ephemera danica]